MEPEKREEIIALVEKYAGSSLTPDGEALFEKLGARRKLEN
jgi:hypothetical protein